MGDTSAIPPRFESQNPFVNGTKVWGGRTNGTLCYTCGQLGHIHRDCQNAGLLDWEQAILKTMVQQALYRPGVSTAPYPSTVSANLVRIQSNQSNSNQSNRSNERNTNYEDPYEQSRGH